MPEPNTADSYFHASTLKNFSIASSGVWIVTNTTHHFLSVIIPSLSEGRAHIIYSAIVSLSISFIIVFIFSHKRKDFAGKSIFISILNGLLLYATVNGIHSVYSSTSNLKSQELSTSEGQLIPFISPRSWLPPLHMVKEINLNQEKLDTLHLKVHNQTMLIDSLTQSSNECCNDITLFEVSEKPAIKNENLNDWPNTKSLSDTNSKVTVNLSSNQGIYLNALNELKLSWSPVKHTKLNVEGAKYQLIDDILRLIPQDQNGVKIVLSDLKNQIIYDTTLSVKRIPNPTIEFYADSIKITNKISRNVKEIFLNIKPDPTFLESCPYDAKFIPFEFKVALVRENIVHVSKTYNQNFIRIQDFKIYPKKGDDLVIEMLEIKRINSRAEKITVDRFNRFFTMKFN